MKLCHYCNEIAYFETWVKGKGNVPCCCTTKLQCKKKQTHKKRMEGKGKINVELEFIIQRIFTDHVSTGWLNRNNKRFDLIEHRCMKCKAVNHNNVKIPLEWHHIDGDRTNNHPSNLTFICSNCHMIHTRRLVQDYLRTVDTLQRILENIPLQRRSLKYDYYYKNGKRTSDQPPTDETSQTSLY